MLGKLLALSRHMMILPVIGMLVASFSLIIYQIVVVFSALVHSIGNPDLSPKATKMFAVGIIESVDVFLIAIAVYIISIGLYALFVDEKVELPRWLVLRDLEDLKAHLVSVVIAVLAVLFLREAVAWDGSRDIVEFGIAVAAVIASLAFFLLKHKKNPS